MSKKASPALVGAFVLGAFVLLAAVLLALGGGRLFEDSFECVLYFEESIGGLDVGAPVEFQGVRVGSVTDVRLVFDDSSPAAILRPVRLRIEANRVSFAREPSPARKTSDLLESLVVRDGLRARLATQSLLTGKLKVELGLFPDQPVRRLGRDPGSWEMPTVSSPLQRVADEVAQLPLSDIVHEVHLVVRRVAALLEPDQAGLSVARLNQTLARLESILGRVDGQIDPVARQSGDFLRSAQETLEEIRSLLQSIDDDVEPLLSNLARTSAHVESALAPDSPLRDEWTRLLEELRAAGQSVRYLANTLEEHPESILRGKK